MSKDTWKNIKGDLAQQLPGHTISTWFDPIKLILIDDKELVLEVPNQFFYDWIESHYRKHINKSLQNLGFNDISTKYIYIVLKVIYFNNISIREKHTSKQLCHRQ